jgi:uncharacterized repeat protein (TIGR03803 family)
MLGFLRFSGKSASCVLLFAMVWWGSASASGLRTLYAFRGGHDGAVPTAELLRDAIGNLYSTTSSGGASAQCGSVGCGTVFKLAPDGTETLLYSFCATTNCPDGNTPAAGLIADAGGNLYGTTVAGGANNCGVVFRLAPDGKEAVLYSFKGGSDGCNPESTLLADASGNLYGTTLGYYDYQHDDGTVFRLAADGTETVLWAFRGLSDGCEPASAVIADSSGNLYGTTPACGAAGYGTVFEVAPNGSETTLHAFTGGTDGAVPIGGLIADNAGNLYGTTYEGGGQTAYCGIGCGTIFRLAPDGTETILHAFAGGRKDGELPTDSLIADASGNLYGTTALGGGKNRVCKFNSDGNCGTVFKLAPDGTEAILHSFTGGSDGSVPVGSLLLVKGALYGTAQDGGRKSRGYPYGAGTVFRLKA